MKPRKVKIWILWRRKEEGATEGFTSRIDPAELSDLIYNPNLSKTLLILPTDSNSSFADLAPNSADLNNSSLWSAGHHIGTGGSDVFEKL